jgi:hypothetical protein
MALYSSINSKVELAWRGLTIDPAQVGDILCYYTVTLCDRRGVVSSAELLSNDRPFSKKAIARIQLQE